MWTHIEETADFKFLATLVCERPRLRLHDDSQPLRSARLGKFLRQHGHVCTGEFYDVIRLTIDKGGLTRRIDADSTNFTRFPREQRRFEIPTSQALPSLLSKSEAPFRLWSGGGEKPCNLALDVAGPYPPDFGCLRSSGHRKN